MALFNYYDTAGADWMSPSTNPYQNTSQVSSIARTNTPSGPEYTSPNAVNTAPAPTTTAPTAPNPNQEAIDREMALRNEISSGWDNYINSIGGVLNDLGGQRTAQENIARNQFQQGQNTLGLQRDQGLTTLDNEKVETKQTQKKTLRDIGNNIKNAFQAGNVYLGTRGAGDSSAADQYSYALTKLGTKNRTDVMNNTANIMNDINQRKEQIGQLYNTEINNLKLALDSQINSIAQWFSQQQQQLKLMQAEGGLNKSRDLQAMSRDLLNNALQAVENAKAQATQNKSQLDAWVSDTSQQVNEAAAEIQNRASTNYQMSGVEAIANGGFGSNPQASKINAFNRNFLGGGGSIFDQDEQKRIV